MVVPTTASAALHPTLLDRLHRPDKLAVLVDALATQAVAGAAVLAGSGLDEAALRDASTRVSVQQMLVVYRNAQRLASDPALALLAGARIRLTHFGLYGYALLASATPRQAIDFALRYRALASPVIGLTFRVEGDQGIWSFHDTLSLGEHSALFRFVIEMQLGTQLSLHRDLLGTALTPACVRLTYPAPAHAARYREALGCAVEFGAAANELRFDAAWLDHPLAFANPLAADLARRTCDTLLAEMNDAASIAGRVAAELLAAPGQFPGIEAVAARMQLHPRTLRRRLTAEGSSFQALRDSVRQQLAQDYLCNTRMSTEDIAGALGFSDTANFRHAFKRWTGHSPGRFRAQKSREP